MMDRDKRKSILISAGLVILLAGLVGLFLYNFELVEEEQRSGYSAEAKRNPLLAAQRFLNKQGYTVQNIRGLDNLKPGSGDAIFISYSRELEQQANREWLLEWIKQGGHLVLELQSGNDMDGVSKNTPFLDTLGVKPVHRNVLFDDFVAEEKDLQIFRDREHLKARFLPQHSLDLDEDGEAEPVLFISDGNGPHIVEFPFGRGVYTVVSEFDLWKNHNIGELDHAALLAHLLGDHAGQASSTTLWLVMRKLRPSLLTLLWNNAWQFVIALLTALALGLWYLSNRFGPGLQLDDAQRRSLMEHIEAIGQFEWRMDKAEHLLSAVRREVQLELERRFPELPHKARDETTSWLAEKLKIPEQDIITALHSPCESQTAFTQCIKILQSIKG